LRLNEDYIPIGSGKPICFHLEWIKREQRLQMDNYMSMQDFPDCVSALNPKIRWQESDPRTGLTFMPWLQQATTGACANEGSASTFVRISENMPGRCYSYQVISSICVLVQY